MRRLAAFLVLGLLAACGSNPPPPDWKTNTQSALQNYQKGYLNGNVALAEYSFARARAEAARTGEPAWVARVELARCGTRTAALDIDACPNYAGLAEAAGAEEKAYAAFLSGNWQDIDAKALPAQYATVVKQAGAADLQRIEDPLSRLIAAGVLFKRGDITPDGIRCALDTASERGWRRPLLAWLGVELKRAEAAGDTAAAEHIRQRIRLVESSVNQ